MLQPHSSNIPGQKPHQKYDSHKNESTEGKKSKNIKKNKIPSAAKREIREAPILLNKGSLTCIRDTDCCIKLSPGNTRKQ